MSSGVTNDGCLKVNRRGDDSRYEIVFHDRLLKNGREVADELGSCVSVVASTTLAHCTMVIGLPADRSPLSSRTRRPGGWPGLIAASLRVCVRSPDAFD